LARTKRTIKEIVSDEVDEDFGNALIAGIWRLWVLASPPDRQTVGVEQTQTVQIPDLMWWVVSKRR